MMRWRHRILALVTLLLCLSQPYTTSLLHKVLKHGHDHDTPMSNPKVMYVSVAMQVIIKTLQAVALSGYAGFVIQAVSR